MTNDIQRVRHPRVRRCYPLHPLESSKKNGCTPGLFGTSIFTQITHNPLQHLCLLGQPTPQTPNPTPRIPNHTPLVSSKMKWVHPQSVGLLWSGAAAIFKSQFLCYSAQ